MARTNCIQWHDDDIIALYYNNSLDWTIYSAISLKQQPEGRHVAPLGHSILIPSQLVFARTPLCCMLSNETTNGLDRSSNPRSPALKAHMLTYYTTDAVDNKI